MAGTKVISPLITSQVSFRVYCFDRLVRPTFHLYKICKFTRGCVVLCLYCVMLTTCALGSDILQCNIYRPPTKLREGNVFTDGCHFGHGRGPMPHPGTISTLPGLYSPGPYSMDCTPRPYPQDCTPLPDCTNPRTPNPRTIPQTIPPFRC